MESFQKINQLNFEYDVIRVPIQVTLMEVNQDYEHEFQSENESENEETNDTPLAPLKMGKCKPPGAA